MTPYRLLITVFKHRKAFISVFVGIVVIALGYLVASTPKYESVAELIVRFGDRSIPEVNRTQATELTPADRREIVLSNAAILGSHDLAQATIEAIGLQAVYPEIVANPPVRWTQMDEAIRQFQKDLSVDVGPQDNIITVSFLHPNMKLVSVVTQKLIDLYIEHQTMVYQNPQATFIKSEVTDAGARLSSAQTALETFEQQWHITDFEQEISVLLKQRGDVDANLRSAQAALAEVQTRQKDLEQLMHRVPAESPEPASGEKYRALDDAESRLADLRAKQSQMRATYTPNSPMLAALNAAVATTATEVERQRAEINGRSSKSPNTVYQTLQTDYLRASADVRANLEPVTVYSNRLAELEQRLSEMQQARKAHDDLVRQRQIDEETYRSLSLQYEDARVKDNLNKDRISPATLISRPTIPYRTARPRILITLLASIMAGFILALGLVLVLEAMDNKFTTAEQVALTLDLPVFATFDRYAPTAPRALITYGAAN